GVFFTQAARLFAHLGRVVVIDIQPGLLAHRHQAEGEAIVAVGKRITHVLAEQRGARRLCGFAHRWSPSLEPFRALVEYLAALPSCAPNDNTRVSQEARL